MSSYPHPIIAREGWLYVTLAFAVAIVVAFFAGFWWSLPFWLLAVFVLQFFRDPPRTIPQGERLVLCPADGRVIVVADAHDPWAQRPALKLSIFMNVFNVHSNRSPVDGTVEGVEYVAGSFVNADLDKASEANERNALRIRTAQGDLITCVQVAGLIARRILCSVRVGEHLARGQRFGFIRFGSRVDVYLPPGSRPRVAVGERVSAASTILAELPAATAGQADEA